MNVCFCVNEAKGAKHFEVVESNARAIHQTNFFVQQFFVNQ